MIRLAAAAAICASAAAAEGQGPILSDFVYANALHTLLHELGHAVVSDFNIPILGEEEDAVDNFATVMILEYLPDDAEWILSDVALQWMMVHEQIPADELEFWGAHALDAQRAYRTLCYLYGAEPDAFDDAVDWIDMPAEYQEFCLEEGPLRSQAWTGYLDNLLPPKDAKPQTITVTLDPHPLKEPLKTLELMTDIASFARAEFDWPAPFLIHATTCQEANAYWDSEARELILCYEILEDWIALEEDASR